MTRSNRTLNRIVLILCALLLLGGAAVAAWPWAAKPLGLIAPPVVATPTVPVLWSVVGGCAVLIVLALAWAVSRGRGGTATAYREPGVVGQAGRVDVDIRVIRDLLHQDLAEQPAVVGVDANAYRLRGRTAIAVRVRARRGSDLPALLDDVRTAVSRLDAIVGQPLPLLVRVTASAGRGRRAE